MVTGPEALSDYVRRIAFEKRLSYREIAKRTGQRISHGTVSDIINRRSKDIKAETLKALAVGLGVPEEEVFAIARGKDPEGNPNFKKWKFAALFDEAEQLTPEQMAKFEILMEMARREVQRMLQEQAKESPPKQRRAPDTAKVIDASQVKEKKRA
jgi:transcriptional regulator with XRE-family HTH domain